MPFLDLLGAHSPESFFSKHWMKEPVVLRPGKLPSCLVLTGRDVVRMYVDRAREDERFTSYSLSARDRSAGRSRVRDLFSTGQDWGAAVEDLSLHEALIVRDLESLPPFDAYCAEVRDFWKSHVSLNCYLVHAAADHFPPHQDGHHIFAIQVSGRKRWFLHPPSHPLPMSYYRRQKEHPDKSKAFVVEVEQGEALYLPVGWVHHAETSEGPSVHLSLGVRPLRWVDYLKELCELAGSRHSPLRDYLPFAIGKNGVEYPVDLEREVQMRLRLLDRDLADSCQTLARHHNQVTDSGKGPGHA
jgi:ribosomal protein L16 Arg81 hydroxylase